MVSRRSIGVPRSSPVLTPNVQRQVFALPSWAHPDLVYWWDEYRAIRDVCEGERAIKDSGSLYLPQLEGMEDDEYAAYVERATFYNFTGRTVSALAGTIMRRQPLLEGLPERLTERMEAITKDNKDFLIFSSVVSHEVLKMGRYAVLVDLPSIISTDPKPYLLGYTAENIIDWDIGEVDGRMTLVRIVLCEIRLVSVMSKDGKMTRQYVPQYRQLSLNGPGGTYIQEVFSNTTGESSLEAKDRIFYTQPLVNGEPLTYLPVHVFGPHESTADIEKAPMQDIARLNLSHYRSYANLEHGRLFCGFPIYYVESPVGGGEADSEFTLGASRVWVTPSGAKPGLLELNGQGLKFLVDGMDQKEAQAASLGGRMMGVRTSSTAESDNSLKLSERNEQAILLNITRSLDMGMTRILRWWAMFQKVPSADLRKIWCYYNKDFLFDLAGAREFRAIQSMYNDGILPIEVIYDYFRKASVIPDWMTLTDFTDALNKVGSFPNNADIKAKADGFPSALAQQQVEEAKLDRDLELELVGIAADTTLSVTDKQTKSQQAVATKNAKAAALKPKPAAPGAPAAKPKPTPAA